MNGYTTLVSFCCVITGALVGCVPQSSIARGTIIMKVTHEESHIDLGEGVVHVGDNVTVLREECPDSLVGKSIAAVRAAHCTIREIGEGTVTEMLGNGYSRITTNRTAQEGDIVELRVPRDLE